jgi:hypothetical protein
MKLTKSKVLELLAALVILLAFNVIFFALPAARGLRHWVSYGFSTLAVILAAGRSFYALWRGEPRSKFYGLPVLYVIRIYTALQLAWGFVFMFLSAIPLRAGIPVSAVMLAACLLGLIAVELGAGEISRIDGVVKEKVFYIRSLQAEAEAMAAKAAEGNLKKALAEYAEAIRHSDPMSSPMLAELEAAIAAKTASLKALVEAGNSGAAGELCGELRQILAERNRKCKLLK